MEILAPENSINERDDETFPVLNSKIDKWIKSSIFDKFSREN